MFQNGKNYKKLIVNIKKLLEKKKLKVIIQDLNLVKKLKICLR